MANNDEYKYKTLLKRFKIKTLSPLHIAGSQPWYNKFDYIYESKYHTVFFIDYDDFLRQLDIDFLRETDEMEIYSNYMNELFKQRKLKIPRRFSLGQEPANIYPFIRDSYTPIIPGSSIKGAIRTAILAGVIRDKLQNHAAISINPEDHYLKKQVGTKKDNNKMFMDTLKIADSCFPVEQLKLFTFSSYSLSNNEFREKKEKKRVVEAIPANIVLKNPMEIRLVFRETDKSLFPDVPRIIDFPVSLRSHYQWWIPQEIGILKKYPSQNIASVIQFYESLLKKLDTGSLLLHVGFGTGWQGKTGAFLEKNRFMWKNNIQDYVNDCRTENQKRKHVFTRIQNDGRYKNYPFPKSRKLVMTGNSLLPPGWMEINEEENSN